MAGSRLFAVGLLVTGMIWVYPIGNYVRSSIDRAHAYEQALRRGRIDLSQISQAPFGYLGWKLFPALLQEERRPERRLIDFLKYVDATASIYVQGQIAVKTAQSDAPSLHPSAERWRLPSEYLAPPMPLDNEEWRSLIRRNRR